MRPAFSSSTNKRPTAALPPDAGRNPETESSVIFVSFHSFHFAIAAQSCDSTQVTSIIRRFRLVGRPHEAHFVSRTSAFRCGGLLRPRSFAREKGAASRDALAARQFNAF